MTKRRQPTVQLCDRATFVAEHAPPPPDGASRISWRWCDTCNQWAKRTRVRFEEKHGGIVIQPHHETCLCCLWHQASGHGSPKLIEYMEFFGRTMTPPQRRHMAAWAHEPSVEQCIDHEHCPQTCDRPRVIAELRRLADLPEPTETDEREPLDLASAREAWTRSAAEGPRGETRSQ